MCVMQVINDEMNKFPVDLITFGTCWLQELPVDQKKHSKSIKKMGKSKYCTWNASGDYIKALSSLIPMMYKSIKFRHKMHRSMNA